MAGITLEQAQEQLDSWLAASKAVTAGQQYEIDTGTGRRMLRRVDGEEIRQQIIFWDGKVKALTPAVGGGRRRQRYVVPE